MFSFILGLMILFLMIAISKAFRKKDFMHPLVMYITPFFVQYFVFYVLTDYSKVSHETMILYIGSIFMYIFGYLVTEMIATRSTTTRPYRRLPFNSHSYWLYRGITIVGFLSIFYEVLIYGVGSGAANMYDAMAWHIDWGGGYNILAKYVPFFYGVAFSFFVYNYDYENENKKERHRFIWATIVAYAFAVLTFSRTSIMQQTIVLVYIVLYRNRERIFKNILRIIKIINKALIGIVILIIAFTIIANLTNKAGSGGFFSKDFYLWSYFSAQIRTLDKFVIAHPGVSDFYYIGGIFSRLLGIDDSFKMFLPTINEFNVFSYIGAVYLDCGNFAYIFQALLGSFVAFIYNMNQKKGGYWTIFYAYYAFAVFMSFYAYQYSLTTYIYLLIVFMAIRLFDRLRIKSYGFYSKVRSV